jgi:crossover junction endodeoxyribonuclease RuvC
LQDIFRQVKPERVCVEQAFYAKNVHTSMILGHARGVALLAAQQCGALVTEYTPREVKKALVGTGAAEKQQVAYMVKMLLKPPVVHLQSDAYDALGIALCDFFHQTKFGGNNV